MGPNIVTQMAEAAQAAQAAQEASDAFVASMNKTPAQTRSIGERPALAGGVRFVAFMVIFGLGVLLGVASIMSGSFLTGVGLILAGTIAAVIAVRMIHVAAQWETGVVLRLGKFVGTRGPGLVLIFPVIDNLNLIDTRVQTVEIPRQRAITRDNVPISVSGVIYFKVSNVESAVLKVQDYEFSILNYAQATLRDVIGRLTLDQMLAEREQVQKEMEDVLEKQSEEWGLTIDALRLQDIDMPEELKRMMSRQASAEREKRATITKAEGDKLAALNLSEAAATMLTSPGAMQLRTLQTLDGLGSSPSNTVVLALPTDIFNIAHKLAGGQRKVAVDLGGATTGPSET